LPAACIVLLALTSCTQQSIRLATLPWQASGQVVVVTIADWDANSGELRTFQRDGAGWRAAAPARPVTIGRAGAAWGIGLHPAQPGPAKREGDGRAPAGVFAIGPAFGYAPEADTALPYLAMDAAHWCIDVVDSPLYNRIVDAREVGEQAVDGSTEPMRRDLHLEGDQRYRQGFVIEHNARGAHAAGSCIFAHVWHAPGVPTAGCTAMDAQAMQALLAWLHPSQQPLFVLLPADEYARLHARWQLPALPPVAAR
jgi:L,D-peptidoglycan transpeptidase YkuD (ErfK/YbiS/YcfS/YnhG family)